jgi:nucleoside-diphosphate-sugar epimerase
MIQKKILITGSEGYFGSVLKNYLLKKNIQIRCLDTNFFSDCYLFKNDLENKLILKDARFISEDDLYGIDSVVHLAGISNDPFGGLHSEDVYDFSLDYTKKLALMCKKKGINFIFASSCSVYGKTTGKEELNEESSTNPQTGYSKNKLQIENILLDISSEKFKPLMLRFSTLYGLSPKMRFDIVINMLTGMAVSEKKIKLNSDGMAWRPFIHIIDACKAIFLSIESFNNKVDCQILNVGSTEENYRIIEIAKIIENIVKNSKIVFLNKNDATVFADKKIQDGVDSRTYKVNFKKAKKYIDFETNYKVSDGVRQMKEKFEEINLTSKKLKEINFYRFQKMNELYETGKINEDLLWKK